MRRMLLVVAHSAEAPADIRGKALVAAARLHTDGAAPACESMLDARDEELRATAVKALVDLQAWAPIKKLVLAADTPAAIKTAALERASDTVAGSLALLRLIDEGNLPDEVRKSVVSRATRHVDAGIRVLYERFIPRGGSSQTAGRGHQAGTDPGNDRR